MNASAGTGNSAARRASKPEEKRAGPAELRAGGLTSSARMTLQWDAGALLSRSRDCPRLKRLDVSPESVCLAEQFRRLVIGPFSTSAVPIKWGKHRQPARAPLLPCYRADTPVFEALSISSVGKIITAVWANGSRFLWSVAGGAAAAAAVIRVGAYLGIQKAQPWWDDYGLILILLAVVVAVFAGFRCGPSGEIQDLS